MGAADAKAMGFDSELLVQGRGRHCQRVAAAGIRRAFVLSQQGGPLDNAPPPSPQHCHSNSSVLPFPKQPPTARGPRPLVFRGPEGNPMITVPTKSRGPEDAISTVDET